MKSRYKKIIMTGIVVSLQVVAAVSANFGTITPQKTFAQASQMNETVEKVSLDSTTSANSLKEDAVKGVTRSSSTDGMDKLSEIANISSNSEQRGEEIAKAFHNNVETIWHSRWGKPNQFPYHITLEYRKPQKISGLSYLPRQDGSKNGIIKKYKLYISMDGVTYNQIASGTWENDDAEKFITFAPIEAKYVKFEVPGPDGGSNGFASASEIKIITETAEHSTSSAESETDINHSSSNPYENRAFVLQAKGSAVTGSKKERRCFGKIGTYEPTGLYVKPNEQVTINVLGNQSLIAYIGTTEHDETNAKKLRLITGTNTISSPTGGLLHFDNEHETGSIRVKVVSGGSPIPFFELGKHTKEDWTQMIEKYSDAPSVQLKASRALVTVSYASAKKYLKDPIKLMNKINEVVEAQDRISGLTPTDPNPLHRPNGRFEGFLETPKKVAGAYAYAQWYGAAFPTSTGAFQELIDADKIGWGLFHEAGHSRQQAPWTWDGMVEVTVNIYSIAAEKKLYPSEPTRLEKEGRYKAAKSYLMQPKRDFSKADGFTSLVMFWQLQLAYGDNFYPELHQLYREIPNDQLPTNSSEKIQGFIYNSSKVAKQNLLPFFDAWGLHATDETRQKIQELNLPLLKTQIWYGSESNPIKPETSSSVTTDDLPTVIQNDGVQTSSVTPPETLQEAGKLATSSVNLLSDLYQNGMIKDYNNYQKQYNEILKLWEKLPEIKEGSVADSPAVKQLMRIYIELNALKLNP